LADSFTAGNSKSEARVVIETAPGEEAQVDYGSGPIGVVLPLVIFSSNVLQGRKRINSRVINKDVHFAKDLRCLIE
jgi:hypothetical protein